MLNYIHFSYIILSINEKINRGRINEKMYEDEHTHIDDKTEVESVQLGYTYIADMDKCPDKCRSDSCNLLYMFPGPFV